MTSTSYADSPDSTPTRPIAVSVVLPAYNEADSLAILLPQLCECYPDYEIIVVDDGSSDTTAEVCAAHPVRRIGHPYNMGNGAAVKSGARAARGERLVFMDADSQHKPEDVARLLERLEAGYDMVVGARSAESQASIARLVANTIYNRLSSWMVGHRIADLTSGLRAVRRSKFMEFLSLLPNGFSYPTTSTMAFFRAGYTVDYLPIRTEARRGKSHIKPLRDGLRFLLVIFKIGTLYSPLKLFIPMSLLHLLLGSSYYAYTYLTAGRFTNMGALLITTAVIILMIGLVSEQITQLMYQNTRHDDESQK